MRLLSIVAVGLALLCSSASADPSRKEGAARRLTKFGGGIALSEYARARLAGDEIGADLALAAPLTPEFLVMLVQFDAAMQLGDAALSRVSPAVVKAARAGAHAVRADAAMTKLTDGARNRLASAQGRSGELARRAASAVGSVEWGAVARHNLALGGAMALTQLLQVDLGGFTYTDAARGDVSKLQHAEIHVHDVDPQSLMITTGVFAAWGAGYTGAKHVGGRQLRRYVPVLEAFGEAVATRFVQGAAAKSALAVAPVPASRAVLMGWVALDLALAIGDTAVLLATAHALDAPFQEWNEERQARGVIRERALQTELAAAAGDAEALERALRDAQAGFQSYRDLTYLPIAQADQQLFEWLRQRGFPQGELDALAERAFAMHGGQVLPALSVQLVDLLTERLAQARRGEGLPLGMAPEELERGLAAHRATVLRRLEQVRPALDQALKAEADFVRQLEQTAGPELRMLVTLGRMQHEMAAESTRMHLRRLAASQAAEASALPSEPTPGEGVLQVLSKVSGP